MRQGNMWVGKSGTNYVNSASKKTNNDYIEIVGTKSHRHAADALKEAHELADQGKIKDGDRVTIIDIKFDEIIDIKQQTLVEYKDKKSVDARP